MIINVNKTLFSTSPYRAGAAGSNTMVIVIPAKIVKDQKIDTSTIFLVKPEGNRIILEKISISEEKKVSADESLEASSQQKPTTQIP